MPISLADAKLHLNVTDSAHDTLITGLIADAQLFFENQTDRHFFGVQAVQEVWDGRGITHRLWLRDFPVNPSAVVVAYRARGAATWVNFPTTAYEVRESLITFFNTIYGGDASVINAVDVYLNPAFPSGVSNIKASYSRGYTTEPADVKLAVLELVAMFFRQRVQATPPTTSFLSPGAGQFPQTGIPSTVKATINNYIRPAALGFNPSTIVVFE